MLIGPQISGSLGRPLMVSAFGWFPHSRVERLSRFYGDLLNHSTIANREITFTQLIFVCMTNILLITSLISLLSNSLTKVRQIGALVAQASQD